MSVDRANLTLTLVTTSEWSFIFGLKYIRLLSLPISAMHTFSIIFKIKITKQNYRENYLLILIFTVIEGFNSNPIFNYNEIHSIDIVDEDDLHYFATKTIVFKLFGNIEGNLKDEKN